MDVSRDHDLSSVAQAPCLAINPAKAKTQDGRAAEHGAKERGEGITVSANKVRWIRPHL